MMGMTAIFRKTLRDARGSAIGVGAVSALIGLMDLLIFPSYRDSLKGFQLPAAMKSFLGEANDISSPPGFLTAEYFSWVPLLVAMIAVILGSAAFAGEEGAGTLDLLLAQPIRRWELALSKALALSAAIVLATLAGFLGLAAGKLWVNFELGFVRMFAAIVYIAPLGLFFLGLSLWTSAAMPNRSSAAMTATATVVASYVLQLLGSLSPSLKIARKFSPFYWSDASRVLLGGFDVARMAVLLAGYGIGCGLAIWALEKRDLNSGERGFQLGSVLRRRGDLETEASRTAATGSPTANRP
jgi:ABC-2 type transport system permease protein